LPDRERLIGPEHPDTVATRDELARWRGRMGPDPANPPESRESESNT
jgi:hypothetical protein